MPSAAGNRALQFPVFAFEHQRKTATPKQRKFKRGHMCTFQALTLGARSQGYNKRGCCLRLCKMACFCACLCVFAFFCAFLCFFFLSKWPAEKRKSAHNRARMCKKKCFSAIPPLVIPPFACHRSLISLPDFRPWGWVLLDHLPPPPFHACQAAQRNDRTKCTFQRCTLVLRNVSRRQLFCELWSLKFRTAFYFFSPFRNSQNSEERPR